MANEALVVTNCTQRKSLPAQVTIAEVVEGHTLEVLAKAWVREVRAVTPAKPASSMYQGRAIKEIAAATERLASQWFVISAGLGLVHSSQFIPAYECTVAQRSDLSRHLVRLGHTTSDWWKAITVRHPKPLSRLIERSLVLLALPSTYLQMVHDDLASLPAQKSHQLRIFTSIAGAKCVPRHLVDCVMPYDERLESVAGYTGTTSDFPQRALRHFVDRLEAASLTIEEARARVSSALQTCAAPVRSSGVRVSDEQLVEVLTAHWIDCGGSSSRLLRYLRDEAKIACEQKRFSRIWQALAVKNG